MKKFVKDIKENDIMWTIGGDEKPVLIPLVITKIKIKHILWSEYYYLKVKLPNGTFKYISILNNCDDRDFNKPTLTDLLPTLKYDYDEEIINDIISTVICFDKNVLWKHHIKILKSKIKDTEDSIKNTKNKLKDLNDQLEYFKKQYDSIQEG